LIVVLQYFGSERAIFAFERNPKSFILALLVVFFALPLLTVVFGYFERAQRALFAALALNGKRDKPTAKDPGKYDDIHDRTSGNSLTSQDSGAPHSCGCISDLA
jgi:hypothetical protein